MWLFSGPIFLRLPVRTFLAKEVGWYYLEAENNIYDPQGSVAQRLDADGDVLSSDLYDAYGNRLSGTSTDPYGYDGQWGYYTDSETGLALCTYRYYDPGNGRWVTRDPIGYEGGVDLYGYVAGNPVNGVDPAGLVKIDWKKAKKIWDAGKHTAVLFDIGGFCNKVWHQAMRNYGNDWPLAEDNHGLTWVAGLSGNNCGCLKSNSKFTKWTYTQWMVVCEQCVAKSKGGRIEGPIKEWLEIYRDFITSATGG